MKTQEREFFSINETLYVILTLSFDEFIYAKSPSISYILKNKLYGCKLTNAKFLRAAIFAFRRTPPP